MIPPAVEVVSTSKANGQSFTVKANKTMKIDTFTRALLAMMVSLAAQAYPYRNAGGASGGGDCAGCHANATPQPTSYLSILGNPTTTAGVKTFTGTPGGTFAISYAASGDVPIGDSYAFALTGFNIGGQANALNKLVVTPTSSGINWSTSTATSASTALAQQGLPVGGSSSGATVNFRYYTTDWASTAGTHAEHLMSFLIDPSTPQDTYQLVVRMSSGTGYGASDWTQEENILLTVVPEPQTYAMLSGVGLVGFGVVRRWAKNKTKS